MSAIVNDSKFFKPLFPSLTQLALVQVTFPLYYSFGTNLIGKAIEGIQREDSPESNEIIREDCNENYKRAKEIVKKIPTRLRRQVRDTSVSLMFQEFDWMYENPGFRDVACPFHWTCLGTIDRIKTAEQFIVDEKNSIRKRFEMACLYCLEESVQALWKEMVASGDAGHLDTADESVVGFWVRWLRDGSQEPWTQALLEIDSDSHEVFSSLKSYCSIFPLLQPEKRLKLLCLLSKHSNFEDFRLSLYSLTKTEEELLFETDSRQILLLYLEWPLRMLFLETAEKVIKYMDGEAFKSVVETMLENTKHHAFADDIELFQGLWDMSPDNWKKVVIADQDLNANIDNYFFHKIRKRKAEADELSNTKRKMINEEADS